MPTIRTSEFTVLQIVGLDAAVVCGHSIISPVALDMIGLNIAVKLFQNVFLPLFSLFSVRYNYPYANELEGLIIFDL